MYQPFTAVSRWMNAIACYTDLYVSGGDTYIRNEAWDDPRHEMGRPTLCFNAPMKDTTTTLTNNCGPNGTYSFTPVGVDSPVINDGTNLQTQDAVKFVDGEHGLVSNGAGFFLNGTSTKFSVSLWYKLTDHTNQPSSTILTVYRENVTGFPASHTGIDLRFKISRSNGTYGRPSVRMLIPGDTPSANLPTDISDQPWENDFYHDGWNHLVFTHAGGTDALQSLYLNGHLVDTNNQTFNFASQSFDPAPASYYPDVYFNRTAQSANSGQNVSLAFVNIYSDVLTQDDVHRHYQSMIRGLDLKLADHVEDLPLRNRTDAQYTRTFTYDQSSPAEPRLINAWSDHPTRPYAFQSEVSRKTQEGASMIAGLQLKDDNDVPVSDYQSRFFKHMSNVVDDTYTYTDLNGTLRNATNSQHNPAYGWSFERFNRTMRLRWNDGGITHATLTSPANSISAEYDTVGSSVNVRTTAEETKAMAAAGASVTTHYRQPSDDQWHLDQGESSSNPADSVEYFRILDQGQGTGDGLVGHEQRIGPMSVFPEELTEQKYKSMRRLMLGQKPLRTRRPTRTVYRNHSIQAPSRTIQ